MIYNLLLFYGIIKNLFDNKTNCRRLSLILSQLLRAFNFKAYHITCCPYEEPFDDCHVIVNVYCPSLNKMIILDPTYNLYIMKESGTIIDVKEFRNALINDEKLIFNKDYFNNLTTI